MADNDMMATLMGVLEPPTPAAVETPVSVPVTPATPSEPQVVVRDTQEPQETPVEVTVTETVEEPLDEFAEAETPEQLFKGITDPSSPRLQQAWDAYKFAIQLAKPPEEGGIGHEPTIEDIRQYHDDHVTITEMITDFETNPAKFMTGMSRVNPLAMAHMVENIPDIIDDVASASPEIQAAYTKLSNKIADSLVDDLLDKARAYAESNPEAKKWFFLTARNLKYFLSGGTVKLDDGAMKASAPVDPFAEERARLKAEREAIENERRMRATESWKGFITSAVNEVESKVIEGFAWPDELKTKHGSFMDTLNKDALTRVKQSIGNIPIAKQELDAIVAKARINFGRIDPNQTKAEFTRTFLKYARPVISKVRQDVLKQSGISVKPKQIVPATTGVVPAKATSVAPTPSQPQARKPGESFDDFASNLLLGALQ